MHSCLGRIESGGGPWRELPKLLPNGAHLLRPRFTSPQASSPGSTSSQLPLRLSQVFA